MYEWIYHSKKSKSVYDFRDFSNFSIIALANTLVED